MRGKWDGTSGNVNATPSAETYAPSLDTSIYEIKQWIDEMVKASPELKSGFAKTILAFINEHPEYYWWIPFMKQYLQVWQNRIDDEALDLSIRSLEVNGRDLEFNPYESFRLYFHTRERLFSVDEDDDEPNCFFEAVMYIDGEIAGPEALVELYRDEDAGDYHRFVNKCKSVLYCTICKACEEEMDAEDLSELLLGVNFYEHLSEINEEIYGGDLSNEVQEDVLLSFGIDRKDFDDEEYLWRDEFLTNWENVAQELIDQDVFDHDFIS
jgi:hypothetical protein